ncbi:hypothetical protein KFE98_13730 [bacterium SCSIO 12741]|nr:hypothetical protein KFE98_13730 [bacterium SCSIO 12741]
MSVQRSIILSFVFLSILLLGCEERSKPILQEDPVFMASDSIRQGRELREKLTGEQDLVIDYLMQTFADVDSTSKEDWVALFKKDLDPDRELKIWMAMAKAFRSYTDQHPSDLETQKEVYEVVLILSVMEADSIYPYLDLKYLSEEDVKEIANAYPFEPQPIQVYDE